MLKTAAVSHVISVLKSGSQLLQSNALKVILILSQNGILFMCTCLNEIADNRASLREANAIEALRDLTHSPLPAFQTVSQRVINLLS